MRKRVLSACSDYFVLSGAVTSCSQQIHQEVASWWSVHSKIVGISNSRESEFPPTMDKIFVGAISESRPII